MRAPLPLPKPPEFLRRPAELISGQALALLLNRALAPLLREGELDFLEGRSVGVGIQELDLHWRLTLRDGRIALTDAKAEVVIAGATSDLLLIAARREDPDTLFFQRRLRIEGDTELGLRVKNLMDRVELEALPMPVRLAVSQAADWVEGARHRSST